MTNEPLTLPRGLPIPRNGLSASALRYEDIANNFLATFATHLGKFLGHSALEFFTRSLPEALLRLLQRQCVGKDDSRAVEAAALAFLLDRGYLLMHPWENLPPGRPTPPALLAVASRMAAHGEARRIARQLRCFIEALNELPEPAGDEAGRWRARAIGFLQQAWDECMQRVMELEPEVLHRGSASERAS